MHNMSRYVLRLPQYVRTRQPAFMPVTDPLGDVLAFISDYEAEYGTQHPGFFQGSYSQALAHAKAELKFLLVYLHCHDHQHTPQFCRYICCCCCCWRHCCEYIVTTHTHIIANTSTGGWKHLLYLLTSVSFSSFRSTLSDVSLMEYVNSNMVFWGCCVTSPEGYRVSQALRENSYPFLALVVLRDGRMAVVGRLEGPATPENLMQRLQVIVRENEAHLVVARAERYVLLLTVLMYKQFARKR